jgi:hypothetical protein
VVVYGTIDEMIPIDVARSLFEWQAPEIEPSLR